MIGQEQRFHPGYSLLERAYIALFGVPVVGLRIRTRNVLRLLPRDVQPGNILDAGSGQGVITFLLADFYPDAAVTGVDMDQVEIDASREIARRAGVGNAHFEVADIRHLPYENRFDLIVCIDILEHIEDDKNALRVLHRALAPEGTLLLHVPARYRRYPAFKKSLNFDVPTHVRPGYLPEEISDKVQKAGFTVVDCDHTFGFLETFVNNIGYMISRGKKKNKWLYALAFPFLNLIGWFARNAKPSELGAGVHVIATKPAGNENERLNNSQELKGFTS